MLVYDNTIIKKKQKIKTKIGSKSRNGYLYDKDYNKD